MRRLSFDHYFDELHKTEIHTIVIQRYAKLPSHVNIKINEKSKSTISLPHSFHNISVYIAPFTRTSLAFHCVDAYSIHIHPLGGVGTQSRRR